MIRLRAMIIPNKNLGLNRLEADIGGKYFKKMSQIQSKLGNISLYVCSKALPTLRRSLMVHLKPVITAKKNLGLNRLDADIKGK